MAVIVEPVLTEEKLLALLAEQHEQPCLDYKRRLDLSDRGDVVELAKDVAAMRSEALGGYIVVGADDHGTPIADLTPQMAKLFDEATLRPKLERYLDAPVVRSCQHTVDGKTLVVLYIAPSPSGWCIFKAPGEYEDAAKRKRIVFRAGDVFVRHGTSSERWNDVDVARLLKQAIARHKETWRTELRAELAATAQAGLTVQQLEQLPATALSWQLDEDGFRQLATELIRRNDDIPIRQLLMQMVSDAANLLDDAAELGTLLARLTTIGALGIQFERPAWLARAVTTLIRIYELGFDANGYERSDTGVEQLWLAIVTHVYALGGLAVRLEDWDAVRLLATRRPRGESFDHYGSWLRHALTMASRANVLDDEGAQGLIARAQNVVRAIKAAHPDYSANDDAVLDSLCQFDALAGLIVIGERGEVSSGNFYPSFARYYSRRTNPALIGIVTEPPIRALFKGNDQLLADAIRELMLRASQEGVRYRAWTGPNSETVRQFVSQHQSNIGTPDT